MFILNFRMSCRSRPVLIQELSEQVQAEACVGQEQMVSGPAHCAQAHVRVEIREGPHVVEWRYGVLLAVDQERGQGSDLGQDPIDLIAQETMFQRRSERLEGELVAVD